MFNFNAQRTAMFTGPRPDMLYGYTSQYECHNHITYLV